MNKTKKEDWWKTTFDHKYLSTYIDIVTPEDTREQISFLVQKRIVKKGPLILDLACGYGRHIIELAKQGYTVSGFDYSKVFLSLARKRAKTEGLNIPLIWGDMRNLDSTSKYDIILCLFTSFGYFKNEKDDSLVLKKISQALKTRGSLFLDIPNSPRVIDYLMGGQVTANDFITRKTRVNKLSNGLVVTTQHEFDSKLIRWNMTRTWEEHKIEKSYRTSVRLYSFIEIKKLLLADGLKITRVWGDFSGSRYNSKSDRMIILAKKK